MHPVDAQKRHRPIRVGRLLAGTPRGAIIKDNIPKALKNLAAPRTAKAVSAGLEGRVWGRQSAQSAGHESTDIKSLALT